MNLIAKNYLKSIPKIFLKAAFIKAKLFKSKSRRNWNSKNSLNSRNSSQKNNAPLTAAEGWEEACGKNEYLLECAPAAAR